MKLTLKLPKCILKRWEKYCFHNSKDRVDKKWGKGDRNRHKKKVSYKQENRIAYHLNID